MKILIRAAEHKDIPFLARIMFIAARSHLSDCPWRIIFNESEARTLRLLERLTQVQALPWSYVGNFCLAEVDGNPAAAMCGFVPPTGHAVQAESELSIAKSEFGYSETQLDEINQRLMTAMLGFPDDQNQVWAIENVAVLAKYRGKGLIDHLFEHVLAVGQKKGFNRAQILCLIGNDAGHQAFERNGFKPLTEKSHPAFEQLFGTPGAKLFVRDLNEKNRRN